ncbi:sirohydrochlorin cobaltochelatase [Succinispira mobilis]|uniref:sirohydrochlorin cobaltochelatase n=1 Tax=Succinispira mobilis TaxID=78120 RepID=UPI0003A35ABF|nr:sirohydrochlorin cobaltochelatase [Succinispira mobilis]
MQKFIKLLLAVCLMLSFTMSASAQAAPTKKALVVASFGTTFPDTLKNDIEGIENALKKAFPDRDFYRVFTSNIVKKRIAERDGIVIDDLKTALDKLAAQGYTDVLVQTTLLTPAEEYNNKILPAIKEYQTNKTFQKLVIGKPLLTEDKDFNLVAKALTTQMPKNLNSDQSVVFMGHGSPHMHNVAYDKLQAAFDKLNIPAVIGVVEEDDHPNFEDMQATIAKRKIKEVILMPLMVVAGDHANNDMAGDEDDSWKNLLSADGYKVSVVLGGLGRNSEIQKIYVAHAKQALKN